MHDPVPTPEAALALLVAGNRRFARGHEQRLGGSVEALRLLAGRQTPYAAILGCADSRVPVELLFDQGLGDLFVTRVAGNIATAEIIGSLEYAAEVLGVLVILVLGHTGCGAVAATRSRRHVPGLIGSLYPYIYLSVVACGHEGLEAVVRQNVRHQVDILRQASPVLSARIAAGHLRVEGAVFDFGSGAVEMLGRRVAPASRPDVPAAAPA